MLELVEIEGIKIPVNTSKPNSNSGAGVDKGSDGGGELDKVGAKDEIS